MREDIGFRFVACVRLLVTQALRLGDHSACHRHKAAGDLDGSGPRHRSGNVDAPLEHVKGEGPYGMLRNVPVDPRAALIIRRFMGEFNSRGRTGYMFQNSCGRPVEGNTQRMWGQMLRTVV